MLREKGFEEPNEGVCEKECLAYPAAELEEIPFVPAIFSVLRISMDPPPPPRDQKVPVNVYALSTSISVLFLGVRAYLAESSTGGCLIIVSPKFDGHGGGPPS